MKWWMWALLGAAVLIAASPVSWWWFAPDMANMDRIENQIEFDLRGDYRVSDPFAECPDEEIEWKPGETFECEIGSDRRPERTRTVTVLMQDDGVYEWVPN